MDVLEKTGVLIENDEALRLLADAGCSCRERIVSFKPSLIEGSLKTAPRAFNVYDRGGALAMAVT